MLRSLLFLALFVISLSAQKLEIYSTKTDTQDGKVVASDGVVVVYKDMILYAKEAIYHKDSGDLELFDEIRVVEETKSKFLGEYAKLNLKSKDKLFRPFFMLDEKSRVWLSSSEASTKEEKIDVITGVTSGCNASDPIWKIEFSSSDYNTDSKWLNLYNARIYIYDIPVFYTPYFGYPLDTTRRSGLLPPMLGFSQKEGFYYEQPIYIAEQSWWDLELRPQIRTARGEGLYSTFRFLDSPSSQGRLDLGYFKEQDKYYKKEQLANKNHYGFNFAYRNTDVLNSWLDLSLSGQSGLYIDMLDMNDVDYLNLSRNDVTKNETSQQLISRANLFYNTDEHYFGAYAKYYKDLRIKNNKKTLQNLPSLHYHNYLNTLLDEHLLYTFDIQSNNLFRSEGKTATQTDINIPISLQTSVFDEYATLKYSADLYAQHTSFRSKDENPIVDNKLRDGVYARNSHMLNASSQLARAFESFTHTLDFGAQYELAGGELESGYYEKEKDFCSEPKNSNSPICEFYNITKVEKRLQLYFSQYFFDLQGSQIVYHRLAQSVTYEGPNEGKGELENELDIAISTYLSFYNNMFYSHKKRSLSKNYNRITYRDETYVLGISHNYRRSLASREKINYLTASFGYRYNPQYSFHLNYSYDLERSLKKSIEVGFLYSRDCFDFGLTYVENNRPILNRSGYSGSIYDKIIYVFVRLKPFMSQNSNSSGFSYRLPGDS
ncbi:MAG: LPS assembly protein LptD [Sulfuricurvum sp.]